MLTIPCFYFPTTVMLIDDNSSMLNNLSLSLDPNLVFTLYEDPAQAFSEIEQQLRLPSLNSMFMQKNSIGLDEEDNVSIQINFEAIRELIYNRQRFSRVTSIVIDHSMPELTGLEFCQRIKHSEINKIMLTGEASPALAIDAFNQGVIDQFIIKATPEMQSHLKDSIYAAQWDFFVKQSKNLMVALSTSSECALFEPAYQDLITEHFRNNYPCEFYLIDQTGSFLFLNSKGETSWIIIRSENELENYYAITKDYAKEKRLPTDLIDALKQRAKIPFLFSDAHQRLEISAWQEHMYPANALEGKNQYYYSIIKGGKEYLEQKNLYSYSEYLS